MNRIPKFLGRYQALLIVVLPVVTAAVVLPHRYIPNTDAYYHIGCARLYARFGWLSEFPWLKHTVLGDSFVNLHLLQHLLLAPIAAFFTPIIAIKLSAIFLSSILAISVYSVLRRWKVPGAALWTVLGFLSSRHLISYACFVKGGTTFFILLIWFIDALWALSFRRALILAWISVYTYVGAPILLLIVVVFVGLARFWDRASHLRLVFATVIGLLAGMLVNPFWPDHWLHVGHEIASVFARDSRLAPGVFRGIEWIDLPTNVYFELAFAHLLVWSIVLGRQLRLRSELSFREVAALVLSIGFFVASLFTGTKILYLFLLTSLLFLPLVAIAAKPWPRVFVVGLLCLGIALSARNLTGVLNEKNRLEPPAAQYRSLARFLKKHTNPGEVVVAPWDDFPGLFLYNTHNHYVVGLNPEFLLRADKKKFDAFFFLYQGKLSDAENLLPTFFDDARHIVVRTHPRNSGEALLIERLSHNRHFIEIQSPVPFWRVYYMK
jgi:hypothetical protein